MAGRDSNGNGAGSTRVFMWSLGILIVLMAGWNGRIESRLDNCIQRDDARNKHDELKREIDKLDAETPAKWVVDLLRDHDIRIRDLDKRVGP